MIVGGRDLDDIGADEVYVGEPAEHAQQFAAGEPARFWRSRPWRDRWVEHINVDRQVDRQIPDSVKNRVNGAADTEVVDIAGTDGPEAESAVVRQVRIAIERPAD